MASEIRVGLRFARADERLLRGLAAAVRRGEIQGDVATFEGAADAARTGEPLIVYCNNTSEAHIMRDLYVRIGCQPPALDTLTGIRPPR
jgi:hypothetical protein